MTDDSFLSMQRLELIFSENPSNLLVDVRSHLEKENLKPVSMNILKEHNNFCAVVVGEPRKEFIG